MPFSSAKIDPNVAKMLAGRGIATAELGSRRIRDMLEAASNLDSFKSSVTNMNVMGADQKRSYRFTVDSEEYADRYEIEAMYLESGITAAIVDGPVSDLYRKSFFFKTGDDDAELAELITREWKRLQTFKRFREGSINNRLYGGGGALLGIDDGNIENPHEPVDETKIKAVRFINVLDKYELRVVEWNNDVNSPNFGEPEMYEVVTVRTRPPSALAARTLVKQGNIGRTGILSRQKLHSQRMILVHASRILPFVSSPLPYHMDTTYAIETSAGWGVGIVQRARRPIRNLEMVFDSLATIVQQYVQAGFSVKGYAELVATEQGRDLVRQRMKLLNSVRSIVNAWIHDSDEELTLQTVETRGLAEMVEKAALHLTTVTRIPLVKLLGISPTGMNATGVSDEKQYFEFLATEQENVIIPNLDRLTRYILLSKEGPTSGVEPDKWGVHANPLHDVSDKEKAEIQKVYADIDALYLDRGVYSPKTCAKSRFGPSEFGTEIQLDTGDSGNDDTYNDFDDPDIKAALEAAHSTLPEASPTQQNKGSIVNNEGGIDVSGVRSAQDVALNGAQSTAFQSIVDKVVSGEYTAQMGILQAKITVPTVDVGDATELMQAAELHSKTVRAQKLEEEQRRFERQKANAALMEDKNAPDPTENGNKPPTSNNDDSKPPHKKGKGNKRSNK